MRAPLLLIGLTWVLSACSSLGLSERFPVIRDDPRFAMCAGDEAAVMAAFPMGAARDYRIHLPAMGRSPELDTSVDPAFVVVFEGMWPGVVFGAPPAQGRPAFPRSLSPGSHDVCVWVGDAATGTLTIYSDVSVVGMRP